MTGVQTCALPIYLLRTEDVHLHTPALRTGTHFLLTLETVVFLFHLLSTTPKPFSSLSTKLAHAVRLGFFYKKTRYINSLLLSSSTRSVAITSTFISSIVKARCCSGCKRRWAPQIVQYDANCIFRLMVRLIGSLAFIVVVF